MRQIVCYGHVLLNQWLILREDITSEAGMTQMFEAKYKSELEMLKKELSNQVITGQYF